MSQQLSIEVKPQNASVAQEKLEATAENNAESNHSSSSKTRVQGQDQSRKGSDAQVGNFCIMNLSSNS